MACLASSSLAAVSCVVASPRRVSVRCCSASSAASRVSAPSTAALHVGDLGIEAGDFGVEVGQPARALVDQPEEPTLLGRRLSHLFLEGIDLFVDQRLVGLGLGQGRHDSRPGREAGHENEQRAGRDHGARNPPVPHSGHASNSSNTNNRNPSPDDSRTDVRRRGSG